MKPGRASKTALKVAIRRASHQLKDSPPVMHDPIAVRLIGQEHAKDLERAMHPVGRDFRAFMAARSRYAEDRLAEAVARGLRQYVILGAGLDTFAYRNPFPNLQVFEVDFPATQAWKRDILSEARIEIPKNLTFVPLDFEHESLASGLAEAGFDSESAAFFGWLGVVPYLTLDAFRATLNSIAALPVGSGVAFDYMFPPATLTPKRRLRYDILAQRVASAGEPFQLFLTPAELEQELRNAGFCRVDQMDIDGLNALYFQNRDDRLKLSPVGLGMIATAWV
jgi:methyltransferase (TIGR00027 family)